MALILDLAVASSIFHQFVYFFSILKILKSASFCSEKKLCLMKYRKIEEENLQLWQFNISLHKIHIRGIPNLSSCQIYKWKRVKPTPSEAVTSFVKLIDVFSIFLYSLLYGDSQGVAIMKRLPFSDNDSLEDIMYYPIVLI